MPNRLHRIAQRAFRPRLSRDERQCLAVGAVSLADIEPHRPEDHLRIVGRSDGPGRLARESDQFRHYLISLVSTTGMAFQLKLSTIVVVTLQSSVSNRQGVSNSQTIAMVWPVVALVVLPRKTMPSVVSTEKSKLST